MLRDPDSGLLGASINRISKQQQTNGGTDHRHTRQALFMERQGTQIYHRPPRLGLIVLRLVVMVVSVWSAGSRVSHTGCYKKSFLHVASVRSRCAFCSQIPRIVVESYRDWCAFPPSSYARDGVSCGRLPGSVLTSAVGWLCAPAAVRCEVKGGLGKIVPDLSLIGCWCEVTSCSTFELRF